jgi:hypothetical protein
MRGRESSLGKPDRYISSQGKESAPLWQREQGNGHAASPARLAQRRRIGKAQGSDQLGTAQKRAMQRFKLASQFIGKSSLLGGLFL